MTRTIQVVGIDPSLRNFGYANADLDIDTMKLKIKGLVLVETQPGANKKTVRQNSDDIRSATEQSKGLRENTAGASIAFVEVPVGSQSARAMASYGICCGILGGITQPMIQLTPGEVKLAAVGDKNATKEQMIAWASTLYPDAPWLRQGNRLIAKNEHLADAVASIHAGLLTADFQAVLRMFAQVMPRQALAAV